MLDSQDSVNLLVRQISGPYLLHVCRISFWILSDSFGFWPLNSLDFFFFFLRLLRFLFPLHVQLFLENLHILNTHEEAFLISVMLIKGQPLVLMRDGWTQQYLECKPLTGLSSGNQPTMEGIFPNWHPTDVNWLPLACKERVTHIYYTVRTEVFWIISNTTRRHGDLSF